MAAGPRARGVALPELLIGLGLLAGTAVALRQTLAIPVSPLYSKVGPTVFPFLTVGGLGVLSALLILRALRGGWQDPEEAQIAPDSAALAVIAAGLVANVVLIGPLGFTVASTVLFALIARGFGSRRPARDLGLGLVLSLAAFFGFAEALGVNIGAGPVERALQAIPALLAPDAPPAGG
jgi:putative tricarboxylic transport membrane protein